MTDQTAHSQAQGNPLPPSGNMKRIRFDVTLADSADAETEHKGVVVQTRDTIRYERLASQRGYRFDLNNPTIMDMAGMAWASMARTGTGPADFDDYCEHIVSIEPAESETVSPTPPVAPSDSL